MTWLTDRLKDLFAVIGAFLSGFLAGKLKAETKQLEKEKDAAEKFTDRPRNLDERIERLRKWRDRIKG